MAAHRSIVLVCASELRMLVVDLLRAAGCSEENAACAATVFVEADLRGRGGQGIDYLPYMMDNLKKGNIDPQAVPMMVRESTATALIDGRRGPGQRAAILAVNVAIQKARAAGAAVVGVNNSTDIFMIGYYADLIATAALVGIVFTSGPPLVHPYGGTERMLSTNPMAFGFPTGGGVPVLCDVATSAISSWRVRQAAYYGEQLPPGYGIDRDGHPTQDPDAVKRGAISPLAGHKGFALGLSVALMSGLLTGSQVGPALGGWQAEGPIGYFGHTFIAIDPLSLNPEADFLGATDAYVEQIKGSKRASGDVEIMIPGEQSYRERKARLEAGVPILDATWDIISELAADLNVALPMARPATNAERSSLS